MKIHTACLFAGFVALSLGSIAHATTRTWPGAAAPCNGTLQACIDGATNGDVIQIATATPVDENISMTNRSLSLTSAPAFAARFANGRYLSVTSNALAGDLSVSLSRLAFDDGYVYANYNGSGTATYDFRYLSLTRISSNANNYLEVSANAGTINATVYGNRITGVPRNLNAGMLYLEAKGGTLNATASFNRLQSTTTNTYVSGGGIFVDAAGAGSAGTFKLQNNDVRGGFSRGGIFLSEGLFSSTAVAIDARVYNNVVIGLDGTSAGGGNNGIALVLYNGTINIQAINNTLTRCYRCFSLTRWGQSTPGTGTASGTLKNNLMVGYTAFSYGDAGAPSDTLSDGLQADYNLLNTAGNDAPPGAHDITMPAGIVTDNAPRLVPGSPAIGTADTAFLALGLIFNGLTTTDADGLRRIKGNDNKADIGAYEFGDTSFIHTATTTNTSTYITTMHEAATDGVADADPFVTANFNGGQTGGVSNNNAFGVYVFTGLWRIFNEDTTTAIAANTRYNVLVAAPGSGRVRHTATAANTVGSVSTVDASGLNGLPDRVALVSQNWSVAGIYNAHPVALAYDAAAASGAGRWTVVNGDGAAMPANAGFNLYFQEPSPNALRVVASSDNLSAGEVRLAHPLLDAMPCASFHVSRVLTSLSSAIANFDVYYSSDSRWHIYSYSGSIAPGDSYDVVIDPAQIFSCTDRIFADDFE